LRGVPVGVLLVAVLCGSRGSLAAPRLHDKEEHSAVELLQEAPGNDAVVSTDMLNIKKNLQQLNSLVAKAGPGVNAKPADGKPQSTAAGKTAQSLADKDKSIVRHLKGEVDSDKAVANKRIAQQLKGQAAAQHKRDVRLGASKLASNDDLQPPQDAIDPAAADLTNMDNEVQGLVGQIRGVESERRQEEAETKGLQSVAANEKHQSKMRQAKYDKQIKIQEDEEEKKTEVSEKDKLEAARKLIEQSKPSAKTLANWKVTVDESKNAITAEKLQNLIPEKEMHFDQYTESMDEDERAMFYKMQAENDKRQAKQAKCDTCSEKCKTGACREWCDLRFCKGIGEEIPLDQKGGQLESQEAINGEEDTSDTNPAKNMICEQCKQPATDMTAQWCEQQGCTPSEAAADAAAPL